ncbi:hypothetical protein jhhlp_005419 [Lomentospora prolificans]|uniref:Uncharacterized protein n=1 Tax=Lomentospora prolificans TaxID=41688 RepID=A0A2N3N6R7_9PEZI|nr:hypothetical protein jhhlp_005419 [Lomentospora prolificans]
MEFSPNGVAFVTGAGGTVGRYTILQFARDGVRKIASLDISEPALENTKQTVTKEFSESDFLSLVVDLNDDAQIGAAFKQVVENFGQIDFAVVNAGIGQPLKVTSELSFEDFDKVLGVISLKGVWAWERLELAQMEKQEPLPSPAKV